MIPLLLRRGLVLLLLLAATAGAAAAQTATTTFNANLGTVARLSLSFTSLAFPDADPDVVPQIVAAGGPLTITAKARASAGGTVTLTVVSTDDLRSGLNVIPAAVLSWTASGPGFVNGTLNGITPQTVGSWNGSGVRTGTQTFRFANSWMYSSGTYSVSLLYTLTSP